MPSGVSTTRNESDWDQSRAGFMDTSIISNPNFPPSNKKKKLQNHAYENDPQFNGTSRCLDKYPSRVFQSEDACYALNNENKSLTNSIVKNELDPGGYLSFSVSSYSRMEVIGLKNRLIKELKQIRYMTAQIANGDLRQKSSQPKSLNCPNASSSRESKRFVKDEDNASWMRMCHQVLGKLMNNKHGYIFKSPVDVVKFKLHDYYQIVKNPMDLGTVKTNLSNNIYPTPAEFAADVRLTFDNALLYNPKGHNVCLAAETLLRKFEDMFQSISKMFGQRVDFEEPQKFSSQESLKKHNSVPPIKNKLERFQASTGSVTNPPPVVHSPVSSLPSPVVIAPQITKTSHGKLPKPKAKDPNKRGMNLEEKQRLGIGLQSLPQEKMVQVVQIIRKRNAQMTDDRDEIELDIEAIDVETLWELDRLVTNWNKMVSKVKRQALLSNNFPPTEEAAPAVDDHNRGGDSEDVKKPKKGEGWEEDVDIGDEIPATSFPPVEIEKDDDGPATSSSSSSGSSSSHSSSSSDSDSATSSGRDSFAEDIHDPKNKNASTI